MKHAVLIASTKYSSDKCPFLLSSFICLFSPLLILSFLWVFSSFSSSHIFLLFLCVCISYLCHKYLSIFFFHSYERFLSPSLFSTFNLIFLSLCLRLSLHYSFLLSSFLILVLFSPFHFISTLFPRLVLSPSLFFLSPSLKIILFPSSVLFDYSLSFLFVLLFLLCITPIKFSLSSPHPSLCIALFSFSFNVRTFLFCRPLYPSLSFFLIHFFFL